MTGTEKLRKQPLGVVVGSLLVVIGGALPWAASGSRDRSSYQLVQFAERNELLPSSIAGVATVWLLVPFAGAAVVAAVALGRRRIAVGIGIGLAVATGALAVAVYQSPLVPRYGVAVSCAGALLIVADVIRHAVRRD